MSEDQFYELARQRIDRKNRRWILWGVDFLVFLIFIGAMVSFRDIPHNVGTFIVMAWFGVLVLHGVIISMTQNREADIASEVAKLRQAADVYEKPKRLELSDDGELSESIEVPNPRLRHN
jgi:hypothetical protein